MITYNLSHACLTFKCNCSTKSKDEFSTVWRHIWTDLGAWADSDENKDRIMSIMTVVKDRDQKIEMRIPEMLNFIFGKIDRALAHNMLQHNMVFQVSYKLKITF